jgi:phage terminase large subunit-like protein
MDQSCEDKNIISYNDKTIEICMNGVSMEDKSEKNLSVQTKASRNKKVESEELMKLNLKRLHV